MSVPFRVLENNNGEQKPPPHATLVANLVSQCRNPHLIPLRSKFPLRIEAFIELARQLFNINLPREDSNRINFKLMIKGLEVLSQDSFKIDYITYEDLLGNDVFYQSCLIDIFWQINLWLQGNNEVNSNENQDSHQTNKETEEDNLDRLQYDKLEDIVAQFVMANPKVLTKLTRGSATYISDLYKVVSTPLRPSSQKSFKNIQPPPIRQRNFRNLDNEMHEIEEKFTSGQRDYIPQMRQGIHETTTILPKITGPHKSLQKKREYDHDNQLFSSNLQQISRPIRGDENNFEKLNVLPRSSNILMVPPMMGVVNNMEKLNRSMQKLNISNTNLNGSSKQMININDEKMFQKSSVIENTLKISANNSNIQKRNDRNLSINEKTSEVTVLYEVPKDNNYTDDEEKQDDEFDFSEVSQMERYADGTIVCKSNIEDTTFVEDEKHRWDNNG